jgi:hypothetical protein
MDGWCCAGLLLAYCPYSRLKYRDRQGAGWLLMKMLYSHMLLV